MNDHLFNQMRADHFGILGRPAACLDYLLPMNKLPYKIDFNYLMFNL